MKDDDLFAMQQYLMRSVTRGAFWKGVSYVRKNESVEAMHRLGDTADEWLNWVEEYLQPEQKQKLNASIRKSRMRQKGKDITISDKAHEILVALSENGKLSFSQVIERKLRRAYLNTQKKSG